MNEISFHKGESVYKACSLINLKDIIQFYFTFSIALVKSPLSYVCI